ncbi:MAG: mechanosensitive ion channel [Brucellaceae bacterium]|nr:mechanosensitive ion channel [Brucellaceae bacterium]
MKSAITRATNVVRGMSRRSGLQAAAFALLAMAMLLATAPSSAQGLLDMFTGAPPAQEESSRAVDPTAPSGDATPIDTLIEILKDDTTRAELIKDLEARAAAQEPPPETKDGEDAAGEPQDPPAAEDEDEGPIIVSLGGRIAVLTQQFAEAAAAIVHDIWLRILDLPTTLRLLMAANYDSFFSKLLDIAGLVGITYGVFLLVRWTVENLRAFVRMTPAHAGFFAAGAGVLMLLVTNLAIVVASWVAGYALSLTIFASSGRIGFHHSLFLNAFLVVEIIHAFIRSLTAPKRPDLRILPISTGEARSLTRYSRLTLSTLIFGQMLLVPIANQNVSFTAGRVFSTAVYLLVLALIVNLVLIKRKPITAWLDEMTSDIPGTFLHFLARFWHVPVLTYLVILFAIVLTQPTYITVRLLSGSVKVVLALLAGVAVASLLTRAMTGGVKLPERFAARVPMLQRRLDTVLPRAVVALKIIVFLGVALYSIHVLGLFDVWNWLESRIGVRVTGAAASVLFIMLAAFLLWLVVVSWIDFRLHPQAGRKPNSRERTLLMLIRNAVTIAILVFATMFSLSEMGINIAPLIASAGVIGLAIGFGSQKLVQDIITGLFIQFEGAIDVGDVVSVGGISGTVERLTVRSAGLRDLYGVYHIVPFSSVDTVSNFMRGFAFTVCDMGVAYREDIDEVREAMFDAFAELREDPAHKADIVGDLEWLGLDRFDASAVVVRVRIKTLPGRQWGVSRAYNAVVKRIFDEREIEIPFPHQTLYFGEDKQGRAPALRIVGKDAEGAAPSPSDAPPGKPRRPARKTPEPKSEGSGTPKSRPRRRRKEAIIPPDSDSPPDASDAM